MKNFCLFSLLTLLSITNLKALGFMPRDTMSIFDARVNGKLSFVARGAYNPNHVQPELPSSHYGECIDVRIKNNSNGELSIKLEAGTVLVSQVNHAQNMLVTKTTYYVLQANQKYLGRIYAMCGELKKNAPDIYVNYEIGKLANPMMCSLVKYIDTANEQNLAGQYAVWAVSDQATVKELGENFEVLKKSQQILEKAGINFNIFGHSTTTNTYTNLSQKAIKINETIDKKPQIVIDTADISLETTPVYKIGNNEGIKIGETAWWQEDQEVWLGIGGILLFLLVVSFFQWIKK
jgi:hypothetical protein